MARKLKLYCLCIQGAMELINIVYIDGRLTEPPPTVLTSLLPLPVMLSPGLWPVLMPCPTLLLGLVAVVSGLPM